MSQATLSRSLFAASSCCQVITVKQLKKRLESRALLRCAPSMILNARTRPEWTAPYNYTLQIPICRPSQASHVNYQRSPYTHTPDWICTRQTRV